MSDESKIIIWLIVGTLVSLLSLAGAVTFCQINITQANTVSVYDGDTIIYDGKLAYINITSGGMTTTVIVYGQLWPIKIVKETYSGNNIKVVPMKGNK